MSTKKANGEGSLYYSQYDEKWIIAYTDPVTNKRVKLKQKKGEATKDFKAKYYEIINSINKDTITTSSSMNVTDIIEIQNKSLLDANKINTNSYNRRLYTARIISNMSISSIPINMINYHDINKALSNITDYSNSTISKVCSMLSSAFDYAVLNRLIASNPFTIKGAIIKPKSDRQTKKVEALTIEQQKAFEKVLASTKDEYKLVFYIALYTGMRVGEILALKREDIDLENKVINVNRTVTKDKNDKTIIGKTTKTYSGIRKVPIIRKLYVELNKLPVVGYIFAYNGNLVAPNTINTHFKKLCKEAGILVEINHNKSKIVNGEKVKVNLKTSSANMHMLRHTFATRCIESGMSAVALSKILGHADIQTTLNTYTSVFNKFQKSELEKVELYLDNI